MADAVGVLLILDPKATPFSRHSLDASLGTARNIAARLAGERAVRERERERETIQGIWCCFEEGVVSLMQRGKLGGSAGRQALRQLVARDGKDGRDPCLVLDIATVHKASQRLQHAWCRALSRFAECH